MAVAMETWSPPAVEETWSPPALKEGLPQKFKGRGGGEEEKKRQRPRIDLARVDWDRDVSGVIDGFSAGGWPIADVNFWEVGPETSDFDYNDMYIDVYSDDDEDSSSSDDDSDSDRWGEDEGEGERDRDVRRWAFKRHPDEIPDFFAKYPEDVREEVRRYFHHFVDDCKYFGKITRPTPKLLFELDPWKSDHLAFPIFPDCHPCLTEHITPLETFAKEALRRYNQRMVLNLVFEELVYANVWVHFPMSYFITFLAKDGSSTPFRCKAHVCAFRESKKIKKIDLFTIEKDHCASLCNKFGVMEKRLMEFEGASHCTLLYNEVPYIKEMPAQCEKAAISYHDCNHRLDANHCASLYNDVPYMKEATAQSEKAAISYNDNKNKRHMAAESSKAKYLKDEAVILQAKSHVSDCMVLCPSKVIRYERGACGYRYKVDTFAELLAADRPYVNFKYKSDFIKKCAEAAVKCYNEKMVADFKLERITLATHSQAPDGASYYVSFSANDEPDGVESLFRARVFHYKNRGGADAFKVDIVVRGLLIGAYPWKYHNC